MVRIHALAALIEIYGFRPLSIAKAYRSWMRGRSQLWGGPGCWQLHAPK